MCVLLWAISVSAVERLLWPLLSHRVQALSITVLGLQSDAESYTSEPREQSLLDVLNLHVELTVTGAQCLPLQRKRQISNTGNYPSMENDQPSV